MSEPTRGLLLRSPGNEARKTEKIHRSLRDGPEPKRYGRDVVRGLIWVKAHCSAESALGQTANTPTILASSDPQSRHGRPDGASRRRTTGPLSAIICL